MGTVGNIREAKKSEPAYKVPKYNNGLAGGRLWSSVIFMNMHLTDVYKCLVWSL